MSRVSPKTETGRESDTGSSWTGPVRTKTVRVRKGMVSSKGKRTGVRRVYPMEGIAQKAKTGQKTEKTRNTGVVQPKRGKNQTRSMTADMGPSRAWRDCPKAKLDKSQK